MQKVFVLLFLSISGVINIHNFSIVDCKGGTIALDTFEGKKILLVNVATNHPLSYQLRGLQELHKMYKDSLVVIGIPSNSFGNEPNSATRIDSLYRLSYGVRFLISQPENITGASAHPIYQWLADSASNGVGNIRLREDYQKFLFDKTGNLMGIYSAHVDPLDSSIQKAILGQ